MIQNKVLLRLLFVSLGTVHYPPFVNLGENIWNHGNYLFFYYSTCFSMLDS